MEIAFSLKMRPECCENGYARGGKIPQISFAFLTEKVSASCR
jgi:hypothetical protein